MKALQSKLLSRTLWITIFTVALMIVHEQYTEAAGVAISYILGEKGLDAVKQKTGSVATSSYSEEVIVSDVDQTKIVTGLGTIRPADSEED